MLSSLILCSDLYNGRTCAAVSEDVACAATPPVGTGNGATGVEAELGQLRGQLQRLKAQMVQAAASQDEELARTQQVSLAGPP